MEPTVRGARTQSGIAAAPAQEPEQRSPKSRNCRYPYKEQRQAKSGVVVVGVGRYREHSDEAAWEGTVVRFMVFFCIACIEQLWRHGTRVWFSGCPQFSS